MSDQTPESYARHLCRYIASDSDVALHVRRMFGVGLSTNRIAQLRRKPIEKQSLAMMGEPIGYQPPIATNKGGYDPLAKALHKYLAVHAKAPADRAHWKSLCI